MCYADGGYNCFAGRDASRGLATMEFKVNTIPPHCFMDSPQTSDTWDELSDLTPSEIQCMESWEQQFRQKYIVR